MSKQAFFDKIAEIYRNHDKEDISYQEAKRRIEELFAQEEDAA